MENQKKNANIDATKNDIVIPGHVVKQDRTFKEEGESDEKIPGVHSENVEGTASEDEDSRSGIDLSDEDRVRPGDADASRFSI